MAQIGTYRKKCARRLISTNGGGRVKNRRRSGNNDSVASRIAEFRSRRHRGMSKARAPSIPSIAAQVHGKYHSRDRESVKREADKALVLPGEACICKRCMYTGTYGSEKRAPISTPRAAFVQYWLL
jgi:hypothetical protein